MNKPDTKLIPSLFFTEQGFGPDPVDLGLWPMRELKDGDKVIAARSLGLRVYPSEGGPGLLLFAAAGGYQLYEEQVRELRDQLTAWLDAEPATPPAPENIGTDGWVWGYSLDSESSTVVSDVFATREEAIADASQNEDEFETAYQRWERFRPGCPFDASQALDNPPDELHESGQDIFCDAIGANEPRLNELLEAAWDTFLAETPEAKPVIYWLTECQRHELAVTRDTAAEPEPPPLELGDIAEPEDTRG